MNLKNSLHQLSKFTPCGSQTLSKMHCRYPENYPEWLVSGKGGKVYDIDGNEYLDLISGLGAIGVGYANDSVNDAVYSQMQKGMLFSLPNPLEFEAAKLLTELVPGTEMWKFGKNGTDGTVMAVRAARAFTGRTKIVTCGYNGCADVFECQGVRNAGIPESLKADNYRLTYGQLPPETREYACVLMEPMVFDYPRPYYLEQLRAWCYRTGALLIFDEVVNGGRFKGYTSANYFEVEPDLYVLGKGLANGFPLCAVGGTRYFMSVFERDDFFASGTFGGDCAALAAFMESSRILSKAIDKMVWNGQRIQDAFNSLPWDARCKGYPTRLNFIFPTSEHKFLFWQEMCKNGVLVGYANFVKADNTDEEISKIIEAIYRSFKTMKDHWDNPRELLTGAIPEEALKGRSN